MTQEMIDKYKQARESDDLSLFIGMRCMFNHFGFDFDCKIVGVYKGKLNTILDIDTGYQIISIPKDQIYPYYITETKVFINQ